ncbi:MAG: hypothetical protein SFW67_30885, partial [Myxococcaceae bacterium]|nr:hypothetical protein [Myxococcaceae bacterium]
TGGGAAGGVTGGGAGGGSAPVVRGDGGIIALLDCEPDGGFSNFVPVGAPAPVLTVPGFGRDGGRACRLSTENPGASFGLATDPDLPAPNIPVVNGLYCATAWIGTMGVQPTRVPVEVRLVLKGRSGGASRTVLSTSAPLPASVLIFDGGLATRLLTAELAGQSPDGGLPGAISIHLEARAGTDPATFLLDDVVIALSPDGGCG